MTRVASTPQGAEGEPSNPKAPPARQCTATSKTTGQRCGHWAMRGTNVCRHHGGSAPQVRAKAKQRQAQAEADALVTMLWNVDAAPVKDNVEAMQLLAGRLQHAVDVLGNRLNTEPSLDGATPIAWGRVLRELRQLLVSMEHLGIAQRHVELEQERASLVTTAVLAGLNAVSLTPMEKDAFLRAFLTGIGRGPDSAEAHQVVRGELE